MANWIANLRKRLKTAALGMDSLDSVEVVMAIEEVFDVTISDDAAAAMATPRHVIEWLVDKVSHTALNKRAIRLMEKIAIRDNRPELANGIEEGWRRPQIEAAVRNIVSEWTGTKSFNDDSSFRNDILS
jgi:hypothetical protein